MVPNPTALARGAELRALDWARQLRLIRFRAFVTQFTRLAGRTPTTDELRAGLGLPLG